MIKDSFTNWASTSLISLQQSNSVNYKLCKKLMYKFELLLGEEALNDMRGNLLQE